MSIDGKKHLALEGRVRLDFRPYLLSDWDVPDDPDIPDSEWTTTVGEVLAAARAASGWTIGAEGDGGAGDDPA